MLAQLPWWLHGDLSANAGDRRSMGREESLEKKVTIHSSILAWEIPPTEQQGSLQSMGTQRIRHNLATKQQQQQDHLAFAQIPWDHF